MNAALRFAPLLVGIVVAYAIVKLVASSSRTTQFVAVFLTFLPLSYGFTWFNTVMERRSGDLLGPPSRRDRLLGHGAMVLGAIAAAYGFAFRSTPVLFAALACAWVGDTWLTPRASREEWLTLPRGKLTRGEQAHLDDALTRTGRVADAKVVHGSDVILRRLVDAMRQAKGVDNASLYCALGALAGYACQASLREHARKQGLDEDAPFVVARTADGTRYFYGDYLNQPLAESKHSVWTLASNAAREAGCTDLPDMSETFGHVTETVGSASFGIPRVPAEHRPKASPRALLERHWPEIAPIAKQFCTSDGDLPIVFGMAIRQAMAVTRESFPTRIAFILAMESAIAMSKVDYR